MPATARQQFGRWFRTRDERELEALVVLAQPELEAIVGEFAPSDDPDLRQEAVLAFVQAARTYWPRPGLAPMVHCRRAVRTHLDRVVGTRHRLPRLVHRVPEVPSEPIAHYDDLEFDARVRERLDRFADTLTGLKRAVFRDRIAAPQPAALDRLADRWGVSPALARRAERAVLEPLRRHLAHELADSLPAVLGAV